MCSSENLVGSLSIGVIIGGLDTSAKIRLIPYSGKSVVIGKVSHCLHLLLVLLYIAFFSYQRNLRFNAFKDSFFPLSFHRFMRA